LCFVKKYYINIPPIKNRDVSIMAKIALFGSKKYDKDFL